MCRLDSDDGYACEHVQAVSVHIVGFRISQISVALVPVIRCVGRDHESACIGAKR